LIPGPSSQKFRDITVPTVASIDKGGFDEGSIEHTFSNQVLNPKHVSVVSTFVAAVKEAGPMLVNALANTFPGAEELTLLIPTNDAFEKYPDDFNTIMAKDKPLLVRILMLHVVVGKVTANSLKFEQLTQSHEQEVDGGVRKGGLTFNCFPPLAIGKWQVAAASGSTAIVTLGNAAASNVVAHLIDTVLAPPLGADPVAPDVAASNGTGTSQKLWAKIVSASSLWDLTNPLVPVEVESFEGNVDKEADASRQWKIKIGFWLLWGIITFASTVAIFYGISMNMVSVYDDYPNVDSLTGLQNTSRGNCTVAQPTCCELLRTTCVPAVVLREQWPHLPARDHP